jgi:hypothetical protein
MKKGWVLLFIVRQSLTSTYINYYDTRRLFNTIKYQSHRY